MSNQAEKLDQDFQVATRELANLNRELAAQMILLASQTGDTSSLIQAVKALRSAQKFYSQDNAPRENAEVQQALGDTLLTLGRLNQDAASLRAAISAYRGAITLASVLSDEMMRRELKRNYATALSLHKSLAPHASLQGAA